MKAIIKVNSTSLIGTIIASLFIIGCASIVSKNSYPLTINSTPEDASVTVTRSDGTEYFKGKTPATVQLDAKAKFFQRETYQVTFSKAGYSDVVVPVVFHIDGWYWGNIVIGGLIGWLIVDPATGAMYKLRNPYLNQTLTQGTASLQIMDYNKVPPHWLDDLEKIGK